MAHGTVPLLVVRDGFAVEENLVYGLEVHLVSNALLSMLIR